MAANILTHARLLEVVQYNAETGQFTRIQNQHGNKICCIAGNLQKNGYRYISIDGTRYREHRLAWFYVHGYIPPEEIDHVNGVKDDNRLSNLREASRGQNAQSKGLQKNNKSGHKGILWLPDRKKWHARVYYKNKAVVLGNFDSMEDAIQAYQSKAKELFTHHRPLTDEEKHQINAFNKENK